MNNFGQLVSGSILELNLLKKKSLRSDSLLSKGLLCDSKKALLEAYLTTIGNSIVMCGSICQMLPALKTVDDVKERIGIAKKMFKRSYMNEISSQIGKVEHCSGCPKNAMLFGILQGQLEDVMFEDVSNKLLQYIGCVNEEIYSVCEEILEMIYGFAEGAVFHLSGLRINCKNIMDEIFSDDRFPISNAGLKTITCKDFEDDPIIDMPPSSCLFRNTQKKECLHLFLCDEFFKVKNWMDVYINLYKTYHKDPKKISLVLDYQLIDDDTVWGEEDYNRYLHASDIFGCVYIINCDHMDFGMYEDFDNLNITTIDIIEECGL